MKRYIFSSVLLSTLFMMSALVFAQSAKEAVMAVKKLQTKVETGISYRDYAPAIAEAKFPVKLFLESPDAKDEPELSVLMLAIVTHYDFANTVWSYKFSGRSVHEWIYARSDPTIYDLIVKNYDVSSSDGFGGASIYIDEAIRKIWSKASEELAKASNLLAKTELKATSIKNENEALKQENITLKKELDNLKTLLTAIQEKSEKIILEKEALAEENENLKTELESLKSKVTQKRKK